MIGWEDLEAVLPGLQFAPLAACLEPDLSPEQQQEKLDYFVGYTRAPTQSPECALENAEGVLSTVSE